MRIVDYDSSELVIGYNNFSTATSIHPIEHGINWIYSFIDYMFFHEFNVFYYMTPFGFLQESISVHPLFYELSTFDESHLTLAWSIFLDTYNINISFQNPYLNSWTRYFLDSIDRSFLLYIHPELMFVHSSVSNSYVVPYITSFMEAINYSAIYEGFIVPTYVFIELSICVWIVALFVLFFFSFYNSATKEEQTIDSDYFLASMTVEAEEEIASIDDIALALVFLLFLFGWYFYTNFAFILNNLPEMSILMYSLPFLYYIIFFVPTLLVYDFGIFFLAYLRGAATTPSLAMELLYDYIAFAAFYVRLGVQNVRLLLMLFTFFSLYECILNFVAFEQYDNCNEYLLDYTTTSSYIGYNSYYFLLSIPTQILYWIYELLHTFFVVTAQFVAFFAMVFWLFLFLYTMFVFEQQEKFFNEKKEKRKAIFKKIFKDKFK